MIDRIRNYLENKFFPVELYCNAYYSNIFWLLENGKDSLLMFPQSDKTFDYAPFCTLFDGLIWAIKWNGNIYLVELHNDRKYLTYR